MQITTRSWILGTALCVGLGAACVVHLNADPTRPTQKGLNKKWEQSKNECLQRKLPHYVGKSEGLSGQSFYLFRKCHNVFGFDLCSRQSQAELYNMTEEKITTSTTMGGATVSESPVSFAGANEGQKKVLNEILSCNSLQRPTGAPMGLIFD